MWLEGFPNPMKEVALDGHHLRLEEIVAVARYRARVTLSEGARGRVACGRAVVDRLVETKAKVYGLTTGFGSKRDVLIEPQDLGRLQMNLIKSHACGVGPALDEDQVRAAMVLRANTLARGNSGVRVDVIEAILEFLNRDIYPWIPSRGSLGASGDLAPLSHLALALCGDPHARFYHREGEDVLPLGPPGATRNPPDYVVDPIATRFRAAPEGLFSGPESVEPLELQAKEGLALNNGTQVSVAIGILTLFDAIRLLESAELICSLSVEAIKGVRDAFDPRLHEARPLEGQGTVAANMLAFTKQSQILTLPLNTARLHRAGRAVENAKEMLKGQFSGDLAKHTTRVHRLLKGYEKTVAVELSEDDGLGADSDTRLSSRDRLQQHYREGLAPLRREVLELYSETLKASLDEEGVKGRDFLADAVSQLQLALPESPSVQDDYSFRCTPQVLGAIRKAVQETHQVLITEANSSTDNPLVFPPRVDDFEGDIEEYTGTLSVAECHHAVVSGGNFHGEPVAFALDSLCIALAELGNISERRTAHLVDGAMSNGLPSLLVWESGINNGLMIPQYVAASLVSENKVLSHPASVDSIPTCENTEDHVSMSALAALKCRQVLGNVETVVAIELFTAWQGVTFRRPLTCGRATERLWKAMEDEGMTPVLSDRVLHLDIEWARRFLLEGKVWSIARDAQPA